MRTLDLEGALGLGLRFEWSALGGLWGLLTVLVFALTLPLGREHLEGGPRARRFYGFSLATGVSALGVFLSSDLFTAFVCFEAMSLCSYALVAHRETPGALGAGRAYLAVSIFTGMLSLLGLFLLYARAGSLEYDALRACAASNAGEVWLYAGGALALSGFMAKAGLFPMHVWLPGAYGEAPTPATIQLSSILSKAGVLQAMLLFTKLFLGDALVGWVLLSLALVTMLLGAVLALTSVDIKRTLAYSSLSQIGFILLGVALMVLLGHENQLAAAGTVGQMINHALQKLLLFTAAGVVLLTRGSMDLNEIRGGGRGKPLLMACFLVGALSIAGVPLFSGFVSKTLLHHAILELAQPFGAAARVVETLFLITGGLTLAYMTKLFVCVFVERGEAQQHRRESMGMPSACALCVAAVLILCLGIAPGRGFGALIGYACTSLDVQLGWIPILTVDSLLPALISIAIGALAYGFVVRRLLIRGGRYVDPLAGGRNLLDGVLSPLFSRWLPGVLRPVAVALSGLGSGVLALLARFVFNKDDDRTEPECDDYFAVYSEKPFLRTGFTDTLAYSFLLMGVGLVAALLYLLF